MALRGACQGSHCQLSEEGRQRSVSTEPAGGLAAILAMIPAGVKVACGDSVTLEQVGVIAELRKRNQNTIFNPMERSADGAAVVTGERRRREQREAFSCEVFLTGVNAVTLDGKLVSTDALGNRVAPMIFGPDKVIIVAGVNKLVKDVSAALERIHQVAAPMNAKRHFLKHHNEAFGNLPCARTGPSTEGHRLQQRIPDLPQYRHYRGQLRPA